MRSSSSAYIPRLDHLRFFAVLLVFSWHALHHGNVVPFDLVPKVFALSIFAEGHTGVSLFLTLSGFVFASLAGDRDVRYGAFLRNRLLRIAPLLAVWTILNFVQLGSVTPERLVGILLSGTATNEFPGAGWTVLVEFQLYLVFPFLLRFRRRYGARYLVGVVLVLLVLRTLYYLTTLNVQFIAYWTVLGRADEFVIGMLGYEASRRFGRRLGHPLVFATASLLWLVFMHAFKKLGGYYFSAMHIPGAVLWIFLPTIEGLFYATIAASYLNLNWRGSERLGRFVAWLGTLSYSIYLAHAFAAEAGFHVASWLGLSLTTPLAISLYSFLGIFPVLVACSALTYYVIELPFLSLRGPYLTDPSPSASPSPSGPA